jgi:phosphoribosylglycinamide formyltransferase 1
MKNIAIFASGSGTNAFNIIQYFSTVKTAKVTIVLVNNPEAYVIKRVKDTGVEVVIFDRNDFYVNGRVLDILRKREIGLVVLAGFLWFVPENIIDAFRGRMVNIHPALLPDFGGKGMYGDRVHTAVINSGARCSGITVHYVTEQYDAGDIIFQKECEVTDHDTPATLAARIHELEYHYYPAVIESLLNDRTIV